MGPLAARVAFLHTDIGAGWYNSRDVAATLDALASHHHPCKARNRQSLRRQRSGYILSYGYRVVRWVEQWRAF